MHDTIEGHHSQCLIYAACFGFEVTPKHIIVSSCISLHRESSGAAQEPVRYPRHTPIDGGQRSVQGRTLATTLQDTHSPLDELLMQSTPSLRPEDMHVFPQWQTHGTGTHMVHKIRWDVFRNTPHSGAIHDTSGIDTRGR